MDSKGDCKMFGSSSKNALSKWYNGLVAAKEATLEEQGSVSVRRTPDRDYLRVANLDHDCLWTKVRWVL